MTHRSLAFPRALLALVTAAPAVVPAQSHPFCVAVDGAATTVFAVVLHHGLDLDAPAESGAARVLARCRLAAGRAAAPELRAAASGLAVDGDLTLVFAEVRAADWRLGEAFARAALAGAGLDDDAIRLEAARAALEADDAEWLYPGPVLRSRARALLFDGPRGRAELGSPGALQALTPARIRELLARPVAAEVAIFGALPAAAADLQFATAAATATADLPAVPVRRELASDPAPVVATHPRIDGPFAAVAYPAPTAAVGLPAFAVALDVAAQRVGARQSLRLTDQLQVARAPAVCWSWLAADPLVVFCQRGHDGDPIEAAFAAVDALLEDFRNRAPTAAEVDRARSRLLHELAPLPWDAAMPVALGRVAIALRARHRGVTADAIAAVTPAAAHAALLAALAPPAVGCRVGLVPNAVPDPFRRR